MATSRESRRSRPGRRPPRAPERRTGVGLDVQAEVHDQHQIELKFNYAVGEAGRWRYFVDAYFFVPRNVGLHRANYTREQFYADFTALMRLDAAPLPLDALADVANPASPLYRFARVLDDLRTSPRPPSTRPVRVHARLYANLFVSGVRAECRRLEKLLLRRLNAMPRGAPTSLPPSSATLSDPGLRVVDPDGAFVRDLTAALDRMRRALRAYREVRGAWWPFERLSHHTVAEAMRAADEYMSVALEERLAQLAAAVESRASHHDGTGFVARVRLHLAELAREEAAYRRRYGYLTLGAEGKPGVARDPASRGGYAPEEYFTYRASLLKKSVQQALYLNVRGSRGDMFIRNAVGAAAAALAAIWATAAQIPTQLAAMSGSTKVFFFSAAVLAYVLKDRIKALTSEALLKRARTYDHTSLVYGESLPDAGLKDFTAKSSEAVRFVSSDEVSEPVRAVRLERRTVQKAEAQAEEVIHYRKRLDVGSDRKGATLPEGYRIRDILRVNVRHFLVRLDDPVDRVDYFDVGRGAFATADMPKVYHVNLVVHVRRESAAGVHDERFAHLRVVLNKNGIVRAEQIQTTRVRAVPRA